MARNTVQRQVAVHLVEESRRLVLMLSTAFVALQAVNQCLERIKLCFGETDEHLKATETGVQDVGSVPMRVLKVYFRIPYLFSTLLIHILCFFLEKDRTIIDNLARSRKPAPTTATPEWLTSPRTSSSPASSGPTRLPSPSELRLYFHRCV